MVLIKFSVLSHRVTNNFTISKSPDQPDEDEERLIVSKRVNLFLKIDAFIEIVLLCTLVVVNVYITAA